MNQTPEVLQLFFLDQQRTVPLQLESLLFLRKKQRRNDKIHFVI